VFTIELQGLCRTTIYSFLRPWWKRDLLNSLSLRNVDELLYCAIYQPVRVTTFSRQMMGAFLPYKLTARVRRLHRLAKTFWVIYVSHDHTESNLSRSTNTLLVRYVNHSARQHANSNFPSLLSFVVYYRTKSYPTTHQGGVWGERRYSSYSLSTSALAGGEWSASRPGGSLAPYKGPSVPTGQESGWAAEPLWTQRLQETSFASAGDRTSITRSSSP
jgi:hypothetical protein